MSDTPATVQYVSGIPCQIEPALVPYRMGMLRLIFPTLRDFEVWNDNFEALNANFNDANPFLVCKLEIINGLLCLVYIFDAGENRATRKKYFNAYTFQELLNPHRLESIKYVAYAKNPARDNIPLKF